jgi:hypothetical protein
MVCKNIWKDDSRRKKYVGKGVEGWRSRAMKHEKNQEPTYKNWEIGGDER